MQTRAGSLLLTLSLTMSVACGGTPVSDAPLPKEQQAKLECTLRGAWSLSSINGEPLRMARESWTFRKDGSGMFRQRPGTGPGASMVTSGDNPFTWELEGRNIFLYDRTDKVMAVYRADQFTMKSMTWFNYRLSDKYLVLRTKAAAEPCP